MQVRKVVIPVAGWGTRSLPATKNAPKEIFPALRKPSIQYIVEEAIASGLSDVVFVNNQNKRIIEDHFDHNLALSNSERKGQMDLLAEVRKVAEMANIIVVRQKQQLGLGHAVHCAKEVIKDEPFAVMVGDDLMFNRDPGINQLIEVYKNASAMPVVGVMEVPRDKVSRYGIIDAEEFAPGLYRIRELAKSQPRTAPRLAWPWSGVTCSRPRFSSIWKGCSRTTLVKSSLPMPCSPWPAKPSFGRSNWWPTV